MDWQSVSNIVCNQFNIAEASSTTRSSYSDGNASRGAGAAGSASFAVELASQQASSYSQTASQHAGQSKQSAQSGKPSQSGQIGFQKAQNKFTPSAMMLEPRTDAASAESASALRQSLEGLEAGTCVLDVNGKQVDIGQSLLEIAQTDFGKFRELLKELDSSDPADFLAALSEITGVPQADIQQSIREMDDDILEQFAADLAAVIGSNAADVQYKLMGIRDMEINAQMVDEKLQSMAAEDFWQFYELIQKLQSDSSQETLQALSELLDLSEEDTQRFVELMDHDQLAGIATALSRASQAPSSILQQQLLESTEYEIRAWEQSAGLGSSRGAANRLEHIMREAMTV